MASGFSGVTFPRAVTSPRKSYCRTKRWLVACFPSLGSFRCRSRQLLQQLHNAAYCPSLSLLYHSYILVEQHRLLPPLDYRSDSSVLLDALISCHKYQAARRWRKLAGTVTRSPLRLLSPSGVTLAYRFEWLRRGFAFGMAPGMRLSFFFSPCVLSLPACIRSSRSGALF